MHTQYSMAAAPYVLRLPLWHPTPDQKSHVLVATTPSDDPSQPLNLELMATDSVKAYVMTCEFFLPAADLASGIGLHPFACSQPSSQAYDMCSLPSHPAIQSRYADCYPHTPPFSFFIVDPSLANLGDLALSFPTVQHSRVSRYRDTKSPLSESEWEDDLKALLLDGHPIGEVEAIARTTDDGYLFIDVRKRVSGHAVCYHRPLGPPKQSSAKKALSSLPPWPPIS